MPVDVCGPDYDRHFAQGWVSHPVEQEAPVARRPIGEAPVEHQRGAERVIRRCGVDAEIRPETPTDDVAAVVQQLAITLAGGVHLAVGVEIAVPQASPSWRPCPSQGPCRKPIFQGTGQLASSNRLSPEPSASARASCW